MLSIGKAIEVPPEHRNRIRWIEADCSKSLDDVPLQAPGTYDIVMANWLFEHATSVTNLEGMWRNIAHYLKPGGRFVGVRLGDPHAPDLVNGKYGLTMYVDIPTAKYPLGNTIKSRDAILQNM